MAGSGWRSNDREAIDKQAYNPRYYPKGREVDAIRGRQVVGIAVGCSAPLGTEGRCDNVKDGIVTEYVSP